MRKMCLLLLTVVLIFCVSCKEEKAVQSDVPVATEVLEQAKAEPVKAEVAEKVEVAAKNEVVINAEVDVKAESAKSEAVDVKSEADEAALKATTAEALEEIQKNMKSIGDGKYSLLATEVTQSMWKKVMGENPSKQTGDDLPVTNISPVQAMEFCNRLSEAAGLSPVYNILSTDKVEYLADNGGFRLPEYDEWLNAAGGKNKLKYSSSTSIDEAAWYSDNSSGKPHPVGEKLANDYELHDMCGNVAEITKDLKAAGGSYSERSSFCFTSSYSKISLDTAKPTVGFRLAQSSLEMVVERMAELAAAEAEKKALEEKKAAFQAERSAFLSNMQAYMIQIPGQSYAMLSTPVTQKMYDMVNGTFKPEADEKDDFPYTGFTSIGAMEFCNKISEFFGLTPCYTISKEKGDYYTKSIFNPEADGFRLPTADEWFFAAAGGEDYMYSGSNELEEVAWTDRKTHAVAQKKANAYGLYDMSGTPQEWCADFTMNEKYVEYSRNFYTREEMEGAEDYYVNGLQYTDEMHEEYIRGSMDINADRDGYFSALCNYGAERQLFIYIYSDSTGAFRPVLNTSGSSTAETSVE